MPKFQREKVKVTMHLPGSRTQLLVEWTYGLGLADGGVYWEVPTDVIPPNLRGIGSRFILVIETADENEADRMSAEEIRSARKWTVEELSDD